MKRVCLIILDGWGLRDRDFGNAIRQAFTPNFERLWHENPHATLAASGEAIGLPKGQMGTSEIGHMTIGAGRIIFQDLPKINQAIESGEFFKNKEIKAVINQVKKRGANLHLLGLVSDGGVHSHYSHLYALLRMAKKSLPAARQVFIHVFTDGRDCRPKSGLGFIEDLEEYLKDLGMGEIATVCGRYYAMDRDHNWGRTDKAYRIITSRRQGKFLYASQAVKQSYEKGITDEFIKPARMVGYKGMKSGDGAVFFNFRNDRPRQLLERFLKKGPKGVDWLTMTRYEPSYPVAVAYPPEELKHSLGEVLSRNKVRQLRVTETEKFAHLTFFLNCKQEEPFAGEDRILLDSNSDIATHDEKPEMRAEAITEEVVQAMRNKTHRVIFSNICNGDMIGHTGNFKAAVKGIETVDKCLGKISQQAEKSDYQLIITADHGNSEEMIDEKTKEMLTAHTLNLVPFILQSKSFIQLRRSEATLVDIAPTILKILGIKIPREMTGENLV